MENTFMSLVITNVTYASIFLGMGTIALIVLTKIFCNMFSYRINTNDSLEPGIFIGLCLFISIIIGFSCS